MRRAVKIKNASVENAGIPTDYKDAIAEYIWNGFDADATVISINFELNELSTGLKSLEISDNGTGIDPSKLDDTFGVFYSSIKSGTKSKSSYLKGNKGKGRFAFNRFASCATWQTVFHDKDKQKTYQFEISIKDGQKDNFEDSENLTIIDENHKTGTTVAFDDILIQSEAITGKEFELYLAKEFGWYLFLNNKKDAKILIGGKKLDYEIIVNKRESILLPSADYEKLKFQNNFEIFYIEWKERIGDDYYYVYYLNNSFTEVAKYPTTYNNNSIGFHHSVFVVSSFFDDYVPSNKSVQNQMDLFKKSDDHAILQNFLDEYLLLKQKGYVKDNKEILIEKLKSEKVLPIFENTEYQKLREKEFIEIVKEVYTIIPQVFFKSNELEKKTVLGFMKLLLDSNERTNIITILESIVDLTPVERQDLAEILMRTKLSNVTRMLKFVEDRYKSKFLMESLIYDHQKFATERDHIQAVFEKNFWIFGEYYDKVASDKTFDITLDKYLEKLKIDLSQEERTQFDAKDRKRRPDLLLTKKCFYPVSGEDAAFDIEENLIVELKRPSVVIDKNIFRQIQDYMDIVSTAVEFASTSIRWKFIAVSTRIDDWVRAELVQNRSFNNTPGLVYKKDKYEILVYTWADLFGMFDKRSRFILDKLDIDKESLKQELKNAGILVDDGSVESATLITQQLTSK